MKKMRVLIVADHTLVREEIYALLALVADIEVVGEAANGFLTGVPISAIIIVLKVNSYLKFIGGSDVFTGKRRRSGLSSEEIS
ncbi:MAG: hypothetical protein QMD03_01890 [Syntrophales bacterium]|nr:hypothetical protein [Syntrophales bacterium]